MKAEPLLVVVALSALTLVGGHFLGQWERSESRRLCEDAIARGLVYYECRHYWDLCAFNYNDCESGERYEWECDGGSCIARRVP